MNDHMTIGEILSGDRPRRDEVMESQPGDRSARAEHSEISKHSERSWHEPVEAVVDDTAAGANGESTEAGGNQDDQSHRAEASVENEQVDERTRQAGNSETSEDESKGDKVQSGQSGQPSPQAAVLHHLERITMPSVALANRMADEFEVQIERANNELKYARQRANLAWSAVAFLGLALMFLAWWTGGSIEGSRATARDASKTVETERQRVVALTNELFEMRRGAQEAQTAERTRSLELVQKIEKANETISQMVKRATDAERRLADASATIAMLEQQIDQLHDQVRVYQQQTAAPVAPHRGTAPPQRETGSREETPAPAGALGTGGQAASGTRGERRMVPADMPKALRDMVEVPESRP